MLRSLWMKFFILLLVVSAIALSAAFMVRELLVADFRGYLEGEFEDRVYWITSALERNYETAPGWDQTLLVDDTVWSLMLGYEIQLYDNDGKLIIDTARAIDSLSPLIRKRVLAIAENRYRSATGKFLPYVLFLGGAEIGRLEVRYLKPKKQEVFIRRSNGLLIFSLVTLGGVAILLSVIFSGKLTRPIRELTEAVTAVSKGDLKRRVALSLTDEIGTLSNAFNHMAQALETQELLRKKMTSNIAHELRTPLSIVRGELEGMMDGFIPLDRENISSLLAEIGRLKHLIEALEDLSQAEASVLALNKSPIELSPYLQNIVEQFNTISRQHGVRTELRCNSHPVVNADPDLLSQILLNLLSNALKATDRNGVILVEVRKAGAGIIIAVHDTGGGIRQEDLPFIFERFYRASEGGLGLGLAIVKELVEAHGATIDVATTYGKGSTFTLSFPS
jgi:two-component system sensor histidine kinase BaeS